ncbi:putative uncharacterized protein mb3249c [Mycobacterium canettii CIPT 140010059]|uniref:Uncharacterized protein n=1 Tax=Mycobacterium canettii (strain CIPT 140010059) TaxID=1048245 RepID=A0AB72XTR1_MYCCP|nr:putative uncharacterized protein mb3249c [Mycobacterium canettii CIPT 140010059]
MSSPVSSRRLANLVTESLQGSVLGGIVSDAVLPAVPDDVKPGAGEDAYGVRVVVAAGSGAVVKVGGPGVGSAAVAGEVADGVAELFVCGPTEPDVGDFAGLAGGGGDAGQAGQRFGRGKTGSAVTDLGEQPGRAHGAGAGQGGEDVRVGVQGELLGDLRVEGLDLRGDAGKRSEQGAGDVCVGGAVLTCDTARGAGEPAVKHRGVDAPAVAGGGQPGGQALDRQPVCAVLAVESGQERQADRRVDVGEQPDHARKDDAQVRAQLVGQRHPVPDQVFASATGPAQGGRGRGVGQQWTQPGPVGAQRVGEHERVEAVVLVAGRAVTAAQILQLVRADHHHREPGLEQGVHHRAVRAFDGDLAHTGPVQQLEQLAQSGGVVLDRGAANLAATRIDDRYRVIVSRPINSTRDAVLRLVAQCGFGSRLHNSLLAARPSGEAPSCEARTRLPHRSLFGARRRSVLSTVGASGATAGLRKTHDGHHGCQASRAITQRRLGCIGQSIQDHRHKDGAPVSQSAGHGIPYLALLAATSTPSILVGDPTRRHRPLGIQVLAGHLHPELIKPAESGQTGADKARTTGSVVHVEVFRMRGVGTPIIGRPRPLPGNDAPTRPTPSTAKSRFAIATRLMVATRCTRLRRVCDRHER